MGRPRVKIIDDSTVASTVKKVSKKRTRIDSKEKPVVKQETTPVESAKDQKISKKPKKLEKTGEQKTAQESHKKEKKSKKKFQKEHVRGKNYQNSISKVDREKLYPIDEAITLACETAFVKFDGTIEVHAVVANSGFRATLVLPHPTGKVRKILIFPDSQSATLSSHIKGQPQANGQQLIVGTDQTLENIISGQLQPQKDFQVVIATPEWMPKLAKVAKILGPKGLMPNPKSGTVTTNLDKTLADFAAGQMEIKTEEKAPLVHTIIGRVSSPEANLSDNLKALIRALGPSSIRKLVVNCTMGPGIKVDIRA